MMGSGARVSIPINGAAESILKIYFGFVGEMLFRQGNIGEGMLDVAAAFRGIRRRAGVRCEGLEEFENFIERDSPSCGHIEYLAGGIGRGSLTGQKIRIHCIVDVGEIAALLAITKYHGLLTGQHLGDEFCHYAGVGRRWILPRTKDIEVTQGYRLESVAAIKRS